jgi:GDP-4-dehydro-6-deoxy-D-mannose reductase
MVVHLAAQSSVAQSWENPTATVKANIVVSTALLQAARDLGSVEAVLTVGSAEEYGAQGPHPIAETAALHPQNPYAVSKAVVGSLAQQLLGGTSVRWYHVRPFNHFGPGQRLGFIVADVCRQIVDIEGGRQTSLHVGNTTRVRDFLAVDDVVRAYAALLSSGAPSGYYNVASGTGISIAELIDKLVGLAERPISVRADPARLRPADVSTFVGNASKIRKATGWEPTVPLVEALATTLNWWRARPPKG